MPRKGREDRGIKDTLAGVKNKSCRDKLEEWVNDKLATSDSLIGYAAKLYSYKKIFNAFNKDFNKITKADISKLLKEQFKKSYYRTKIKEFFRWAGKSELVNWIDTTPTPDEIREQRKKITLTEGEAAEILKACDNAQDRALLEIFADNPTRPKDLEGDKFKIKHVRIDEFGVVLSLTSKTQSGKREIYLQNSRAAFLDFWKHHPYKDNPESPVFYSVSKGDYGAGLLWGGMNNRLKRIVNRAKIPEHLKKHISLYTWRRTVTTWRLQDPDYTPSEIQRMGGWSSIRMLDTYGRVTDKMVNLKKMVLEAKERKDKVMIQKLKQESKKDSLLAKLMSKYGLLKDDEKINLLGSKVCPRCKQENLSDSDFCSKCWLPLKPKIMDLKEKVIEKSIKYQKPLSKQTVKEIIKEMKKNGEL